MGTSRLKMAQPADLAYAVTARDVGAPALIKAFSAHLKRQGKMTLPNNLDVGHFATTFGGQQRRGTRTNKFGKGFTGVNRRALQELAKIGIVKVDDKNGGRILTSVGRSQLDAVAYNVAHPDKAGGKK